MFCSDDKHPDDLGLGHINFVRCKELSPIVMTQWMCCVLRLWIRWNITDWMLVCCNKVISRILLFAQQPKDFSGSETVVGGQIVAISLATAPCQSSTSCHQTTFLFYRKQRKIFEIPRNSEYNWSCWMGQLITLHNIQSRGKIKMEILFPDIKRCSENCR